MVQKINGVLAKKFRAKGSKINGVLPNNSDTYGSKHSAVYCQKIKRLMVQKIQRCIGKNH